MRCEHLHHRKKDRHGLGEPCPVETRLNSTTQLDDVQQAIAWLKSEEVNAGPRTLKAISLVLSALENRVEKVRAANQALQSAVRAPAGWAAPSTCQRVRLSAFQRVLRALGVCHG